MTNTMTSKHQPILYCILAGAIFTMGKFVPSMLLNTYKHYATKFAHHIVAQELASDRVKYEIRGETIVASDASDADLRKALFYERTRAVSCEDAMRKINAIVADSSPAL